MHRQRRQLKPNIPYNKNFAFQKAAAHNCAAAFCCTLLNWVAFYKCRFPLRPFPLNMVRAKRRPFPIGYLLLCADICRHGIHRIVMQNFLLYSALLPAGEDLSIRESIVQRPQTLQPRQRKRLRFGAVQRFLLLPIKGGFLHRAGQGQAEKLQLQMPGAVQSVPIGCGGEKRGGASGKNNL